MKFSYHHAGDGRETLKAVLYARYSTDMQRNASITDQYRYCEMRLRGSSGIEISGRFSDEGISGATAERPGYQSMLSAAEGGQFGIIVVDELSRLWRDQAEQWRCLNQLRYVGVHVISLIEGIDTRNDGFEILAAFHGAMAESERRKIAHRTHRGLTGKAEAGASCGGRSYGYRSIPIEDLQRRDSQGQPEIAEYRKVIVEEEAEVIRNIYRWFADGHSPMWIANHLNELGIPSPRGRNWARSAIYGDQRTGVGILNNPIYVGVQIWNRSRWVTRPDGKQRKRIERDPSEWVITEHPELRIIDEAVYARVTARLEATRKRGKAVRSGLSTIKGPGGRYPRHLLSGMMRCGVCGGNFIVVDRYRYGCAVHKDRGPHACNNHLKVSKTLAETLLLKGVKERLLTPERIELFRRETTRLLEEARREAKPDSQGDRERLKAVEKEIGNLVSAIREVGISPTLRDELRRAESEKQRIQARIAAAAEELEALPRTLPDASQRVRELVSGLERTVGEDMTKARALLSEILDGIRLLPSDSGEYLVAEAQGSIASLLQLSGTKLSKNQESLTLVAGAGFEPATFGL
ncbi:MAG: recombinase family protein [Pseudomonadota bacterium]